MQSSLITTLLFSIFLLTECNQKRTGTSVTSFDSLAFSEPYHTLKIEARFSECGEWGGHKEKVVVFADTNSRFYATYSIFPFNCDSIAYYYGKQNLTPLKSKTILLSKITKKAITNYLQRLTQSKLTEKFPGHAGNSFSASNSDSSFYIHVYDNKSFDVESFQQLIVELTK